MASTERRCDGSAALDRGDGWRPRWPGRRCLPGQARRSITDACDCPTWAPASVSSRSRWRRFADRTCIRSRAGATTPCNGRHLFDNGKVVYCVGARKEPFPLILGHEGVGVVVESRRDDCAVGQRVTWSVADSCGHCQPCTDYDLPQKCESLFKSANYAMSVVAIPIRLTVPPGMATRRSRKAMACTGRIPPTSSSDVGPTLFLSPAGSAMRSQATRAIRRRRRPNLALSRSCRLRTVPWRPLSTVWRRDRYCPGTGTPPLCRAPACWGYTVTANALGQLQAL